MNPERLAHSMEADFRTAFQRALAASKVRAFRITPEDLLGSVSDIMGRIPWQAWENDLSRRLYPLIRSTLSRSIEHTAGSGVQKADTPRFIIDFAIQNPDAIAWARRHAGELVLGLSQTSRDAVREVVADLAAGKITRDEAAKRIKNVVGLTPTQARQLVTYERTIREFTPPTLAFEREAQTKVETYRQRLLADRATLIARTETMMAANEGQQKAWESMKAMGVLDDDARREWIVTPDERLCQVCAPIPDKGPVGLHEPFIGGDGVAYQNPPAHPACRCTTALVFLGDR